MCVTYIVNIVNTGMKINLVCRDIKLDSLTRWGPCKCVDVDFSGQKCWRSIMVISVSKYKRPEVNRLKLASWFSFVVEFQKINLEVG